MNLSAGLIIMKMMSVSPKLSHIHKFSMKFYDFYQFFIDLCSKSLVDFCCMVLFPSNYLKSLEDVNFTSTNAGKKKSSCNVNIPDIEDTIQVATEIQSKLGLNTQVCHKLSGNVLSEDYLFFGNYWLEPGDIIEELGFGAR